MWGSTKIWNAVTGTCTQTLEGHSHSVYGRKTNLALDCYNLNHSITES